MKNTPARPHADPPRIFLSASFLISIFHLQTVLKKAKSKMREFFEDGVSCCLPLDPAVRVKALDVEVGATQQALVSVDFGLLGVSQ